MTFNLLIDNDVMWNGILDLRRHRSYFVPVEPCEIRESSNRPVVFTVRKGRSQSNYYTVESETNKLINCFFDLYLHSTVLFT